MKKIIRRTKFLKQAGILQITAFLILSTSAVMAKTTIDQPLLLSVANTLQPQTNIGEPIFDEDWIHFDDGTNVNAIGCSGGGTFEWGIRITPTELAPYDGEQLTTVRHHHGWEDSPVPFTTTGHVKIYEAGTSSSPGTLITSELYTVTDVDWFDVWLSSPVTIDASQDLWVCIETTHEGGEFPAGCGPGPIVSGKGAWITLDGGVTWNELTYYGANFNWNLWAGIGGTSLDIRSVSGGLGVSPVITNIGNANATNVEYTITVTGGILDYINKTISDTIPTIAAGAEETIRSGIIFGLGPISIKVTAEAENAAKAIKDVTGFIFGPFVILQQEQDQRIYSFLLEI